MVDISPNSFSFNPGLGARHRVKLDQPVKDESEIILNFDKLSEMRENEARYKRLFLRTLGVMMKEAGYTDVNVDQLFNAELPSVFSSQLLLLSKRFEGERGSNGKIARHSNHYFRNESTTRFLFQFNFMARSVDGGIARAPICGLDAEAIEILQRHGVTPESVETWGRDFLRMADLAEHDYIHQLTTPHAYTGTYAFAEPHVTVLIKPVAVQDTSLPPPHSDANLEDHALTLHAKILHRLFEDSPRQKKHVIQWAAEAYHHMHEMQQQALAQCQTDSERQSVNEAITYFAEIYSHRLFRVISPEDPALHEGISMNGSSVKTSIAKEMDSLTLITPEHLKPVPMDGLGKLERHCSEWLKDTYRAVHRIDSFPLAHLEKPLQEYLHDNIAFILGKKEKGQNRRKPSGDQAVSIKGIESYTTLGVVQKLSEGSKSAAHKASQKDASDGGVPRTK